MPRREYFQEGMYYHVYNRGLRKETLFHREEDFEKFMHYVNRYTQKCKETLDIIAYCLLPNHFHFIFLNKVDGYQVSYFIGNVCAAYVRYYQTKYSVDTGRIYFEGRFKCKEIDDKDYLQQCIYYVQNNPVKHGLIEKRDNRIFTSSSPSLPGAYENIPSMETDLEGLTPGRQQKLFHK